jgi:hypothetical protein
VILVLGVLVTLPLTSPLVTQVFKEFWVIYPKKSTVKLTVSHGKNYSVALKT